MGRYSKNRGPLVQPSLAPAPQGQMEHGMGWEPVDALWACSHTSPSGGPSLTYAQQRLAEEEGEWEENPLSPLLGG